VDVPALRMDGLAVGDYLDCQKADGLWDVALIEKFSQYRTEMEIAWTDGTLRALPFP
jgi:hypothetical protein